LRSQDYKCEPFKPQGAHHTLSCSTAAMEPTIIQSSDQKRMDELKKIRAALDRGEGKGEHIQRLHEIMASNATPEVVELNPETAEW
jgi:hypothetical protein